MCRFHSFEWYLHTDAIVGIIFECMEVVQIALPDVFFPCWLVLGSELVLFLSSTIQLVLYQIVLCKPTLALAC